MKQLVAVVQFVLVVIQRDLGGAEMAGKLVKGIVFGCGVIENTVS